MSDEDMTPLEQKVFDTFILGFGMSGREADAIQAFVESALASLRARNADLEAGYSSSTRRELDSEARALAAEKQRDEWAFQCGEANAGEDIAEARALAAEATIEQAPHDSMCNSHRRGAYGMDDWICDCWKADYDAAKEAQK